MYESFLLMTYAEDSQFDSLRRPMVFLICVVSKLLQVRGNKVREQFIHHYTHKQKSIPTETHLGCFDALILNEAFFFFSIFDRENV